MIIGFDGNEANVAQRVGVNTYAWELLKNFKKLQAEGKIKHELIVYLKNRPLDDMPKESTNFKYKILKGGGFWIVTRLMPDLFFGDERPDVFFAPSHYLPLFSPVPMICSIMDLGYLEYSTQFSKKDFWQLKLWSAISIFVSKRILAISNATKKDIVRHYPFAKEKTYAVPLAYDKDKFNTAIPEKDVRRVKNSYSIVDDYVLYLGTLKPSKNIEGLIKAFSLITNQYPQTTLVIAGKKGWMYETIYKLVENLELKDRVIFTGFVKEEDKPALIAGAKVFVLPSFWEGFGLDALSAMACGVPVIAGKVGSLPEVVGEAGILVDPHDIDSIASGVNKVLSSGESDYNSMINKGLRQVKNFSWEKTARNTLEIIEKAVDKNERI